MGAKATLVVPPEMGFGSVGHDGDDVPGGATVSDIKATAILDMSLTSEKMHSSHFVIAAFVLHNNALIHHFLSAQLRRGGH